MAKDNRTGALSDEIAALLKDEKRTCGAVKAMLSRVECEVARLTDRAREVRDHAFSPALQWAEVSAMRAAADEADFERDRIERAAEVLESERARLEAVEAESARLKRYRAADAQAGVVAAMVRKKYPVIAAELLELIGAVVTTTREIVAVNSDLPAGEDMLRGPEDRARGVNLTAGTRLPGDLMLLCEAVIPPLAPGVSAIWPRDGFRGYGMVRGTRQPQFEPYGGWPTDQHIADARAALAADAPAPGVEA